MPISPCFWRGSWSNTASCSAGFTQTIKRGISRSWSVRSRASKKHESFVDLPVEELHSQHWKSNRRPFPPTRVMIMIMRDTCPVPDVRCRVGTISVIPKRVNPISVHSATNTFGRAVTSDGRVGITSATHTTDMRTNVCGAASNTPTVTSNEPNTGFIGRFSCRPDSDPKLSKKEIRNGGWDCAVPVSTMPNQSLVFLPTKSSGSSEEQQPRAPRCSN